MNMSRDIEFFRGAVCSWKFEKAIETLFAKVSWATRILGLSTTLFFYYPCGLNFRGTQDLDSLFSFSMLFTPHSYSSLGTQLPINFLLQYYDVRLSLYFSSFSFIIFHFFLISRDAKDHPSRERSLPEDFLLCVTRE